jgi:hypothetical protein
LQLVVESLFLTGILCISAHFAIGQDLEPRSYANLPTGTNALALVYAYSKGNILTDPSKPIAGAEMKAHNLGFGYVRTFGLFQKLARVQFTIPYTFLSGKATINGRDTAAARNGFGDARIRLGINLFGSPALSPKEFRNYKQKTIFGISLVTSVPLGLYYKDKLINLGSNRWAFKPEVGISRRFRNFYAEAYAGIWFFTKNKSYLVNKLQEQEPVFSLQGHFNYYFKNQMWIGVNGNWFDGGETRVNEVPTGNLQDNWRIGATWSVPVNWQHSFKLQFHIGAFTSTGYDYNLAALSYQYVFF